MATPAITVYGAHWCPDCRRAKKFLGEQRVQYAWVDVEQDADGERLVLERNGGKRLIPTVVFPDGSSLAEPTNAALAAKLGLRTEPLRRRYDLVVVGGGPTGLTAAIYAAREGIETLVVERSALGGQAALTTLDNFPGFPEGVSGVDFADRVAQQARRFGVEILQAREVEALEEDDGLRAVRLAGDSAPGDHAHHHAQSLLIATGSTYRRLGVAGEEDLVGAGVHFCATCDGPFYKGAREIVVVGGGNSAVEEGFHLTRFAERVTLLVRGDTLTASRVAVDKASAPGSHLDVRYRTVVEGFEADGGRLAAVRVRDERTGATDVLRPAAVFVFIGQEPNSGVARTRVRTDPHGFILTGVDVDGSGDRPAGRSRLPFETSWPGVFAAGDVRHGSTKQVAAAVGEGAAAAIAVRDYLRQV